MMSTLGSFSRRIFPVLVLTGFAATLAAQSTESGARVAPNPTQVSATDPDRARMQGGAATPNDSFGTQDRSVLWIPAASFSPRTPAGHGQVYDGTGYIHRTAGTDLMWADLRIPNGSLIDTVRAWIHDNSASASTTVFLTEFGGTSDGITDIGNASSVDGDTSIAFFPAFTVDYSNKLYVIYMSLPIDANVQFKGVRVLWYRQVSAAPATATFGDVPTTSGQFRFVEALVAAGITAGCGSGNYCPNQAVTRGQMAVFLAVSLGLHHPF